MAYADLLADVADTLDRDDVATRLPRWLKLVEARLNRLLQDPDMEVTFTTTATGTATALPADFGEMVSISTGNGYVTPMGPVEFAGIDTSITGTPRHYAIVNGTIRFAPANSTAAITMVYRRSLPPLNAVAATNWLLDRAPDVYFYGVLLQANAWDADNEAAAGWKSLWDEAIAELRQDSERRKWGAGPLVPRIGRR
jgi:hypothetical protein